MSQPNWVTPIGVVNQSVYSLGNFPSGIEISQQLQADPVNPATSVTYKIISGFLPAGLLFNNDTGLIYGTPSTVNEEVVSTFTIRATDNFENIKDRTFKMAVTGTAIPSFITPAGSLFDTEDSVWISFNVLYDNPDISNIVKIRLLEGSLPPGLEINSDGLIRGYPEPPTINVTLPSITTAATLTETTNNITCLSTTGFIVGRPVRFSGTVVFGGITAGVTYYIKTIVSSTSFTISTTPNGPTLSLTSDTGFMTVTVEAISVGQPTKRTYNFTLKLDSLLGGDSENYSITIRNQNLSTSEGGPGLPLNSRIPTILNTQPETFYLNNNNEYFGYYVLPPNDSNFNTYPPTYPAFMGQYESNNYFAFKVIGKDFDNNVINYAFSNLPLGLTGNSSTGWIVGTPTLNLDGINQFGFNVYVYKVSNPVIKSETFNFSFNVAKNIEGNIDRKSVV